MHDLLAPTTRAVMLDALGALGLRRLARRRRRSCIDGLGGRLRAQRGQALPRQCRHGHAPADRRAGPAGGHARRQLRVSGVPRMHERPIGDLVDALRAWAASIDYLGNAGYPPLRLPARPSSALDAPMRVRGDVSSQFLTALLLALPLVAEQRHPHRGRRRADLQALHRDHAGPAGALRHRGGARGLGALRHPGRQPLPLAGRDPRRRRCFLGLAISSALGAIAADRCAHAHRRRGQRFHPGRCALHRSRRAPWARRSTAGPNWLEVRRGAWPLKAHRRWTATTSPTRR